MEITMDRDVMEKFVKSLGFNLEEGFITKNGELVEAIDGDKIHIESIAIIRKNDEDEVVFVRDDFNELVSEVRSGLKTDDEDEGGY